MNKKKILERFVLMITRRCDEGIITIADASGCLSDILDSLVDLSWISVENDKKPEHEEKVLGFVGYWWVFQYHAEHDHYLEYSERRKRWELTTNSHRVTKWQPLPS